MSRRSETFSEGWFILLKLGAAIIIMGLIVWVVQQGAKNYWPRWSDPYEGKTFRVTDATGATYENLRKAGLGWNQFSTANGRVIRFRGDFTIMEESLHE